MENYLIITPAAAYVLNRDVDLRPRSADGVTSSANFLGREVVLGFGSGPKIHATYRLDEEAGAPSIEDAAGRFGIAIGEMPINIRTSAQNSRTHEPSWYVRPGYAALVGVLEEKSEFARLMLVGKGEESRNLRPGPRDRLVVVPLSSVGSETVGRAESGPGVSIGRTCLYRPANVLYVVGPPQRMEGKTEELETFVVPAAVE